MFGLNELRDVQGIIGSGYGERSVAVFLLFRITNAADARAWLTRLIEHRHLQFCEYLSTPRGREPHIADPAVNIAFTAPGLAALGLEEEVLRTFSSPFVDGMHEPNRARRLGDDASSAPGLWRWGAADRVVHGVVMVYAGSEADAPAERQRVGRARAERFIAEHCGPENGITEAVPLLETSYFDEVNARREHFGFRDGIQNPTPRGLVDKAVDMVDTGEFLLGYKNEAGYAPIAPEVPERYPRATELDSGSRSGFRALGKNGTYMVFRELEQDVPAFWRTIHEHARSSLGDEARDEHVRHEMEKLGAKMVGRWRDGAPLALHPHSSPGVSDLQDFYYDAGDPYGHHCPIGSHIRRTNPRDTLLPVPSDRALSATSDAQSASRYRLEIANIHRLIRRGRPFGDPVSKGFDVAEMAGSSDSPNWPVNVSSRDAPPKRGTYFIALNANIQRQFEFVQTNWALNPTFAGLRADPDPILGAERACPFSAANFTVQGSHPRRYAVKRVIEMRGGAYFFVPSKRALRVLASLPKKA